MFGTKLTYYICFNLHIHICFHCVNNLCVFTLIFKLPWCVITVRVVSCNWTKHQSLLAHCLGTHSAPKSQHCPCVVEILQTFYQGPSQLHCVFSSTVRQLGFEFKSPKLSKMWLPPLNFTQTNQRQVLEGGICPDFLQNLSCARKGVHIHSYMSLASKDPIYMPGYQCNPGPQQTLHTPWHHLKAISDPLLCHDITWEETLSNSCADTKLVMLHMLWLFHISPTQLVTETRRSEKTLWFTKVLISL